MNLWESYQYGFMVLAAWREARNQPDDAIAGVCWVIKNRVSKPGWWGHDIPSVVLKPSQFASFSVGDPNAQKFPDQNANSDKILNIVESVMDDTYPDVTNGATSYHDKSVTPGWASSMTKVADIGDFLFYRS